MDLSEDGEGFVMGYEGWRWGEVVGRSCLFPCPLAVFLCFG